VSTPHALETGNDQPVARLQYMRGSKPLTARQIEANAEAVGDGGQVVTRRTM
jgi:hypothetical protein